MPRWLRLDRRPAELVAVNGDPTPTPPPTPVPSLRGDREAVLWLLRNTDVPTGVVLAHYLDEVPA